jgi:hypothetical protein
VKDQKKKKKKKKMAGKGFYLFLRIVQYLALLFIIGLGNHESSLFFLVRKFKDLSKVLISRL